MQIFHPSSSSWTASLGLKSLRIKFLLGIIIFFEDHKVSAHLDISPRNKHQCKLIPVSSEFACKVQFNIVKEIGADGCKIDALGYRNLQSLWRAWRKLRMRRQRPTGRTRRANIRISPRINQDVQGGIGDKDVYPDRNIWYSSSLL